MKKAGTRYSHGKKLVAEYIAGIFPEVEKQLKAWMKLCRTAESGVLGAQAASSIALKRFHAQGGSIYALYPGAARQNTLRFIVAFQTISDYLDNLCDRMNVRDEYAFRQLHMSMLDAVDPSRRKSDYYRLFPHRNDSGYLNSLVEECRARIAELPSYRLAVNQMKNYIQLYTDLQSYKHLNSKTREENLKTWAGYYASRFPDISCWEFSAAAGSTLGVFVLFASAHDESLTADDVLLLDSAYFPWICGLHILLDYYIDAVEDMQTGDLNFTYYYKNLKQCEERIAMFIKRSLEKCRELRYPEFHRTVVEGLVAMYLSDPKALQGMNRMASRSMLAAGAGNTMLYYRTCRLMRSFGML